MKTIQMRQTKKIRLIGYLCCVCVMCMTGKMARAQQAATAAPSSMADVRMLKNVAFGFQVLIPASMRVDTLVQKIFDGPRTIPSSHAWAFIQAQIPSKADPHWQRILVSAFQGRGIDETQWTSFAASRFRLTRDKAPKGSMVDSVVRWTADTVEMRLGIEDPVTGEFVNERCIGSKAGRPRSAVVCVQTAAETAEALAPVRESLVLTSRDWR